VVNQKFCSNCGKKLDPNAEIRNCPKCGIDLKACSTDQPSASRVEHFPYKSPGTAALIAFIGGIFALPGIGHIYVRKVGMGVGILVGGFILYALTFTIIISVTSTRAYEAQYSPTGNAPPLALDVMIIFLVLIIGCIVLFIWQIFHARKLAKKFNELVKTTYKNHGD
jgi:TM2 domain-containing membrane protein YozV